MELNVKEEGLKIWLHRDLQQPQRPISLARPRTTYL